MKKIDITDWKEFVIGELFSVSRPATRSQAKYQEGNIASVIRCALTKYPYADQLNSKTVADENIKLPVDELGNPDWNYMCKYMAWMMKSAEANLNALEQLIH